MYVCLKVWPDYLTSEVNKVMSVGLSDGAREKQTTWWIKQTVSLYINESAEAV